jgi:two-component system response regulator RegA
VVEAWKSRVRSALVVDDDARVLAVLVAAIQKSGVAAVGASTLADAREALRTFVPNTCVVDLQLPDGLGLDLIRELRAAYADARIALLTGYGSMDVGAMAIKAGADVVIAKPATASEIMQRIYPDPEAPQIALRETASVDRAIWEHVQRVLHDCGGNKSLAARRLRVDRGTLKRWLAREAPTD